MNLYQNAVIFAGGKSSRMGRDKALLPFENENTLTEFQYKKLKKLFNTVYISAKKNKFDFECVVIEDVHTDASPLVALLSIFQTLDIEDIFVLSVDAPFVDQKTIKAIMNYDAKDVDAVIAVSPNGIEPLCGLYKKSMLPFIQIQYKKNNHKLRTLLESTRTHFIAFEEKAPFANLNHPQEYQKALDRLLDS